MIIGISGGIASGKSTITAELEKNYRIIDADLIAREVINPQILQQIKSAFGAHFLLADGQLNRPALRQLIFNSDAARLTLNKIMHPPINQKIREIITTVPKSELAFLSAPLLLENGLEALCDWVLVIDVLPQIQLARLIARDEMDVKTAQAIINAQISREKRLLVANFIIDNSGKLFETKLQLQEFLKQIETFF